ncbi:FtsQ-type POTRA domain-containing protein [Patescibacteria group bacterium]|nr:FtsQ-type POTRA domain-containing protein [Patescibacteria group bacterium]
MARVSFPMSQVRARRRGRRARIALVLGALLLVLCGGAIWFLHAPFVRVTAIDISGAESVTTAQVREAIRDAISGAYLYAIPKDSIFFYPKRAIEQNLLKLFPALKSAIVHAENFDTLAVVVAERAPQALWCGAGASSTGCALMDEGGVVYAPAADFSGDAYVRYFGTATPLLAGGSLPAQYLTEKNYRALFALVAAIGKTQPEDPVRQVVVDEGGDARVYFQQDFLLIFSIDDNSADVYERFTLALTAEPFTTHALPDFEYLDLRFGDKLYYKLKGQ